MTENSRSTMLLAAANIGSSNQTTLDEQPHMSLIHRAEFYSGQAFWVEARPDVLESVTIEEITFAAEQGDPYAQDCLGHNYCLGANGSALLNYCGRDPCFRFRSHCVFERLGLIYYFRSPWELSLSYVDDFFKTYQKGADTMPSTVPKIEVQYYPQPNCSGNLCKIVVEATDLYATQRMVMSIFNIPERNIFSTNFAAPDLM